jgi:hypothetical protein
VTPSFTLRWLILLTLGTCAAAPLARAQQGYAQKEEGGQLRKLTAEERMTLIRGLASEYAKVKVYLPRSRHAVKLRSDGTWDKLAWADAGEEWGPVAKVGDTVQITKVDIDDTRIVLEINHGFKPKGKWYQRVEMQGGIGGVNRPVTSDVTKAYGTTLAIEWPARIPPGITPAEVKKLLQPVLDFERRTAADDYFSSLPPEIQSAIKARRAAVGMTRDQVLLALGTPREVQEHPGVVEAYLGSVEDVASLRRTREVVQ